MEYSSIKASIKIQTVSDLTEAVEFIQNKVNVFIS